MRKATFRASRHTSCPVDVAASCPVSEMVASSVPSGALVAPDVAADLVVPLLDRLDLVVVRVPQSSATGADSRCPYAAREARIQR